LQGLVTVVASGIAGSPPVLHSQPQQTQKQQAMFPRAKDSGGGGRGVEILKISLM